ncbi:MAG: protein translocase subunit SecF [Syntrophobacteraceae bacterium]
MELIRPDINIDFVGMRVKAVILSCVLIVGSLVLMVSRGGLNLGVDFAGGTLIQIKFEKPTTPDEIRAVLKPLNMDQSAIQQVGATSDNEFLIRTDVSSSEMEDMSQKVQNAFSTNASTGEATVRRAEMVGPKVGADLRQKALFAIFYAMLFIAIYISGRFEMKWATSAIMAGVLLVGVYLLEAMNLNIVYLILTAVVITLGCCWVLKLPFALAAVLALIHDVLITVGAFVLTDKEFTLEILAALLTIAGYSLNDTIVVFDRIRENLRKDRKQSFSDLINTAVNQTLSRTILTGGTTLAALVFLFLFGGTVIHDFAFAMLVGIVTGTYSSIFIASPLLILYEDWTKAKRSPARASA